MKIAVISDTHGLLDKRVIKHLQDADEIWHAGDIGDVSIINRLESFSGKLRAVFGNIDGQEIRIIAPEYQAFSIEGAKVLITHIAGNPPKYNTRVRQLLHAHRPDILVCGHSHILKVMFDKRSDILFINPGSCGNYGIHQVRTLILFEINNSKPTNMKVVELGPRGSYQ